MTCNVKGQSEVDVSSVRSAGDENAVFDGIGTSRENEVPHLKSCSGLTQALSNSPILNTIQVGVLESLKCLVGDVDMDNRAVVPWPKGVRSRAEEEEPVDGLGIPGLEDVWKENEEKMYTETRPDDERNRIARDVPFICGQR